MNLGEVAALLQKFSGVDLTATLARIESDLKGVTQGECAAALSSAGAEREALVAAATLKQLAGQINVAIHALGILLCLPHILEPGEKVEYVSLGAGNTGREFDLETNHRIAEFKFIHWQGGPESIRQNSVFKDFFLLADSESSKRKYLYVLGTEHPLRFMNGGRALDSVLSKNISLNARFRNKFENRYQKVREYYTDYKDEVAIEDVSRWLPELISETVEQDEIGTTIEDQTG